MQACVVEQAFVEGSGQSGVVYVSMGTVCSSGAEDFRQLAVALSSLQARVVWKVSREDVPKEVDISQLGLGDNVMVRHIWPLVLLR